MNKISNYEELVLERKRIENKIEEEKRNINQKVSELKEKFEPLLYVLPFLSFFKRKDQGSPLLKTGMSLGIDWLLGRGILSKANWLVKLLAPAVLRSVTSKVIGSEAKK
jgi:hypothetical protein